MPHILDVFTVPDDHSKDLEDLRILLTKHGVPKDVSIRLIHKLFDTCEGEVMVFDKVTLPGHGQVQIMKPVVAATHPKVRGIHYFVNDEGTLQVFEYGTYNVPDMTSFADFLAVFERGLQHKFGLKLKCVDELDCIDGPSSSHDKRSTVRLQDGMPMPDGNFDE